MNKIHTTVLILLFLIIIAQKADPLAAVPEGCNASRIADCLADDEEFLMESETSRRFLGDGQKPEIVLGALNGKLPFCEQVVYGSCIGKDNKIYKRKCDYQNNCGRDA